jgi:FdhE protein
MSDVFDRRLRRAVQLEKEWPFAANILAHFRKTTEFQRELAKVDVRKPRYFESLEKQFESFCALIEQIGPPVLARKAVELGTWDARRRFELLRYTSQRAELPAVDLIEDWLARTVLAPWAVSVADEYRSHFDTGGKLSGRCPCCHEFPQVSVLREDKLAETTRRSLICCFCFFEWDLPRVLCPNCREERPEKMPRYTAQEIPWVRVEACDSCMKYLKAVDLTKNPDAEPIVDELASTPLDIIARERGYTKLVPNLAGV